MTQISKNNLKPETQEEITNQLWQTIAITDTPKKAKSFFENFLTHTEKITLAKRLAAATLLKEGKTASSIKKALHISNSKIEQIKKWLNNQKTPKQPQNYSINLNHSQNQGTIYIAKDQQ